MKRLLTKGAASVVLTLAAVGAMAADVPQVGSAAPGFSLSASDRGMYQLGISERDKTTVLVFFRGLW